MKKILPFLTLSLMLISGLQAQPCSTPTDITLSTQAEVDSFQANYGPCDTISGNLWVQGAGITNLDSLSNITSIGGYLSLQYNAALTNVDGLSSITSVGGFLHLFANNTLTNLDGLANITSVGGYLQINNNDSLTNVDGLANITSLGGYININSNTMLTNVDGLSNITAVGGSLAISFNSSLTNVDGLSNITAVGGSLVIDSNDSLYNIDGLSNISSVGDFFAIVSNDGLALCCGIFPLLDAGSIGGGIFVQNNLPGCNSQAEITANCAPPPVPTMSQWAMFLFGLVILSLGTVGLFDLKSGVVLSPAVKAERSEVLHVPAVKAE